LATLDLGDLSLANAGLGHHPVIGHGDLTIEHDFSPAGQLVAERSE